MSAKPGYKDFGHPKAPGIHISTFPALQRVLSDISELECAPVLMLKGRKKVVLRKGGRRWMEGSSI